MAKSESINPFDSISKAADLVDKVFETSVKDRAKVCKDIIIGLFPHLNVTHVEFADFIGTKQATEKVLSELTNKDYLQKWYTKTQTELAEALKKLGYVDEELEERIKNPVSTTSRLWTKYHEFKSAKKSTDDVLIAIHKLDAVKNIKDLMDKPIQKNINTMLDIAAKESRFDQRQVSQTGAVGAYQLTSIACKAVNERYNTGINKSDVYYTGKDEAKHMIAAENNAKVAVLYWHLCKNHFAKNMPTEKDKNLAAMFIYNAGYGTFSYLWNHFKSKSYADFEAKLSKFLIKNVPGIVKNKSGNIIKPGYNVVYKSKFKENNKSKSQRYIKIGTKTFEVQRLLEPLEYVRIVEQISHEKYIKKTPKLIAKK